ncbi:hypothetical protein LBMAG53_10540 [Planctomycetota bacterium]|nr:hypothetical protein LBMAG53_10540 [Planctomycetota bacterium]
MGDDGASRSTSHWPLALAAVPVVLVLYVLSIGPVAWLALHTGVEAKIAPVAMVIYAPVVWLHDHTFLKNRCSGTSVCGSGER